MFGGPAKEVDLNMLWSLMTLSRILFLYSREILNQIRTMDLSVNVIPK